MVVPWVCTSRQTHAIRETARAVDSCSEGYGGMDPKFQGAVNHMLGMMPGHRCPYPPGDRPGGGAGLDRDGHWIGV